jgi:hypothetical protein
MALYPRTVARVKAACVEYRSGLIGVEQLQFAIWNASQEIVAVDERELRNYLQNAEGSLELLRFTVDETSLPGKALEVIAGIEDHLKRWE